MSRTGLSPADIAESFRDRCGDGSVEWVYTPTQTWVLLDAADMLDENAELRKERDFYFNQVTENGERAQRAIDALNDENAKLREQIHWLKQGDILHVLTDQEYIDQCERERLMQVSIDALDKENAKLRELVRDYERCTMHADCDKCEYDGKMSTHCPMSPCFPDSDELHELGVDA